MKIIGCDFHTRYQQIAMMDEATGELIERRGGRPFMTVLIFRVVAPSQSLEQAEGLVFSLD